MNFDLYTNAELHEMIASGKITNAEVVEFYNNPFWADGDDDSVHVFL